MKKLMPYLVLSNYSHPDMVEGLTIYEIRNSNIKVTTIDGEIFFFTDPKNPIYAPENWIKDPVKLISELRAFFKS